MSPTERSAKWIEAAEVESSTMRSRAKVLFVPVEWFVVVGSLIIASIMYNVTD